MIELAVPLVPPKQLTLVEEMAIEMESGSVSATVASDLHPSISVMVIV